MAKAAVAKQEEGMLASFYLDRRQAKVPGVPSDQRPHMELTIYWPPKSVQHVPVLVETGMESTLVIILESPCAGVEG